MKPPDAPDAVAPLVPLVAPFVVACDGAPKVNPDAEAAPEGVPKEKPPDVIDVVVPASAALEDSWDVVPKNAPNPVDELLFADAGAGATPEGTPNVKPVGAAGAAVPLVPPPPVA